MVKMGAVREVKLAELDETFEGGDEGKEVSAKKWQDCVCCPCDFIIGVALLVAIITQIAVIVSQFMGNPNAGTILFVLLYCTLVRLMWAVVACCFYCMPKCADMCRCPLRTIFGLLTFVIVCLGFAVNNQG